MAADQIVVKDLDAGRKVVVIRETKVVEIVLDRSALEQEAEACDNQVVFHQAEIDRFTARKAEINGLLAAHKAKFDEADATKTAEEVAAEAK